MEKNIIFQDESENICMMNSLTMHNRFFIRRLDETEYVNVFDCGDDDLNDFIINESVPFRRALLAVTYVLAEKSNPDKVIAFCSLANDRVSLSDFDSKTEFNRFRRQKSFPQAKRLKSYPAVKLCRLAVDKSAKGMSVGSLLIDFIKTYFVNDKLKLGAVSLQ